MNILELDSYNLADAVKFHDRLNHRLWDRSEHLRPEVHAKLMEIARDFQEFLGVPDLDVKDITISGSNAAYNYTPSSDIDLHLVIDLPEADHSEVYRELFDAKKFQYNETHNIKIGGYDVELYVQNPNQEHHSQGIYSLLRNAWVSVPRRKKADIDDISTRSKYEDLVARIDATIATGNYDRMSELMKKIRAMRQSGLEQQGEFGADNLAFKMLRNNGYIKRLVDAKNAARDRELSLDEAKKKKKKVKYGFGTYWYPGFAFGDAGGGDGGGGGESRIHESPDGVDPTTKMFLEEPVDESPDGVNPTTKMFLDESDVNSVLPRFFDNCIDFLGIQNAPEMVLHHNTDWSESTGSFGQFDPDANVLHLATSGRHVLDILRTMAHELTHCRQNEKHPLPPDAGATGSRWEDQANAMAGRIMRHWADEHPEMFKDVSLEESASGYIPKNKKEARDPRYAMALSVDIKPGQVGKEANKLALNTGRNGEPGLLMKSANLRESRMPQPSQGPGKYRDLNTPLGPESPPKMPAGTIKVDVSDTQDWYQLGQDISNLDIANKDHYNQGPPHTVLAFGSEELEHMYSKQLKRLGLPTHDLDEPGEEEEGLDEELIAESIDDVLFEINMSTGSLRREAAKTGAIAGMEFEMIVPNVEGGDDEMEPDYDQDERCRSIEDAVNFFHDGDYNGRREVERLREKMQNDFQEWLDDKIYQDWERGGEEYLEEWVPNNVDESEWNPDGLEGEARTDALEVFIASMHADPGSSDAFDEFREENEGSYDESDWLDAEDLDLMSGVENAYSMSWPHWTSGGGGGEANIEDVAQEFENAIGRDTRASGSYHSGQVSRPSPTQQHYVVEPDGSLEPDDSNDQGLEFVSPPLPIDELLSDLNKVKQWAGIYGCYTNDSTGLHINISVPDYSIDKLDFVKLALLMGDKYVLDAFGRTGNTYAKSALGIIKDAVRNKPEDAARLLDKMKGNLDQLATKAIHSGITSKYTSINTKDGHIEFRSPGGDWLDDNFDKIENTLLRFTVAMSAALNPEAYRQEYLTKLYKLLSENNEGDDTIKYFSDYVAGKIPQAALRSFVKQAQLQRKVKRGETGNQKMWWKVGRPGYGASAEVVAANKEEAIAKGKQEYPDWANAQDMTAKPLRPYQEPETTQAAAGPTLNGRPSNPDGNYVIVNMADETKPVYRYMAASAEDTLLVLRQWVAANPGQILWHYKYDPDQRLGQPAEQNQGNWGIWIRATDRFANQPGSYSRNETPPLIRFPSQAAAEQWIEQQRATRPNMRSDIEVREIEPTAQTGFRNALSQTDIENRLGWGGQEADANYEVIDRRTQQPVFKFIANTEQDAARKYSQYLDVMMLPQETEDYGFREIALPGSTLDLQRQRADQYQSVPIPGVTDVELDIPLAQQPSQQTFTGEWKVVDPQGREIYRFSGVGNNQGDANRVAIQWLQRNPRHMQDGVEVLPVMG